MSTIAEIESAIEKLPASQLEELAIWLEAFLARKLVRSSVDDWPETARCAARSGVTTAEIMKLTLGNE